MLDKAEHQHITVRVNSIERDSFKEQAQLAGLSLSAWVRKKMSSDPMDADVVRLETYAEIVDEKLASTLDAVEKSIEEIERMQAKSRARIEAW